MTPVEPALRRDINRWGFAVLALNSVIGAGIFGLPAVAAAHAGAFSPWLFLICALLILTVVLSFARAASLTRETGGVIVYASLAFGPFVGFQVGWLTWLGRATAMAANSNLLATYIGWFWEPASSDPWRALLLVAAIGGLTWVNVRGVRHGLAVAWLLTILKLLPISLLVLFGLGHVQLGDLFGAAAPELNGLGETLLVLLYAFVGFEGAAVTAGEGRAPRRDLPWALISTTLLIALIYFSVQLVAVAVLPDLGSHSAPLADVAVVLVGTLGAVVMTLGAVFSVGGNMLSSMLSAPRMTWALARDGSLPDWFAAVHPRHQTPHHSIWFYGAVCLALALSGSFVWLAAASTLVRLLAYIACIAALPRLARAAAADAPAFHLPGGMLIPGLALLLCLGLLSQASLRSWLLTLGFALTGALLYAWSRRPQRA